MREGGLGRPWCASSSGSSLAGEKEPNSAETLRQDAPQQTPLSCSEGAEAGCVARPQRHSLSPLARAYLLCAEGPSRLTFRRGNPLRSCQGEGA